MVFMTRCCFYMPAATLPPPLHSVQKLFWQIPSKLTEALEQAPDLSTFIFPLCFAEALTPKNSVTTMWWQEELNGDSLLPLHSVPMSDTTDTACSKEDHGIR